LKPVAVWRFTYQEGIDSLSSRDAFPYQATTIVPDAPPWIQGNTLELASLPFTWTTGPHVVPASVEAA